MQTTDQAPAPKLDNLFGVCHALGETFGFNPLYLRLAIVFGILFDAKLTLAAYVIAGLAVLAANGINHFVSRRAARRMTQA
jgi:phage shock protein PspC (stress-responsive transcriptional regulator)